MAPITQRIADIEFEMARTQKNKATEYHLGLLKARLAKLRTELLEPSKSSKGGDGFEVQKFGDARVALIGFPSVGKSTLLSQLTGTESEVASYEFTTLTCIPGTLYYNDAKIQILDLPGIIEGAAEGKGRGRQVIATAKASDLVLMVLDAGKGLEQRPLLERELEMCGLRLNSKPPPINFVRKKGGGIAFNSTVPLTKIDAKMVYNVLHEYKIHNAHVLFKGDCTVDDLIDVIEGNRKYVRCLYVYNKIDMVSMERVDYLARLPNTVVISCNAKLNLDRLLTHLWDALELVRVYTKRRGEPPDFSDPIVLTKGRNGVTVESAISHVHRDLVREFRFAYVYGRSCKHSPQTCGLAHPLEDEDVVQIVKKTGTQAPTQPLDLNPQSRNQIKKEKAPLKH